MPRINEYRFEINNEEYLLTWYDKPRLTKNGIEQKVKPLLRENITTKNLPIQIVNSKGNDEVPYTLARKILEYFSNNTFKIKKTSPNVESKKNYKPNSSSTTNYTNEIEIEKLSLSKNFRVVMMCSKSKQNNSELIYDNNKITFKAITHEVINQFKPDDDIPGNNNYSWRNYVSNNQNHINLPYRAYELYTENVYQELFMTFGNRLYIESAGWGIINAEFRLPNYDITFSNNINEETIRHYEAGNYDDYNQLIVSNDDDIVFIGTEKYLPLFFNLTNQLPNRKIIYWKKNNTPIKYPIPNNSFIYRRYKSNSPRRWFYELASKIANGIIP